MKKIIFIFFMIISASALYAEEIALTNLKSSDEAIDYLFDESYFKIFMMVTERSITIDQIKNDQSLNKDINYFPNSDKVVGIELNFYHIGVSFSTEVDSSDEEDNRIKGSTDYRDFMLSYYSTNFGVELHYQKYKGFYLRYPELHGYIESDPATKRSDLEMMNIGGRIFYNIVDLNTYSIAAVCNQSERQKDFFAVALLAMLSADKSSINSDYSLIPPDEEADYGKYSGFRGGEFTSVGIAPGIGAILAGGNLYSAASIFFGGGYQSGEYKVDSGYIKDKTGFTRIHIQMSCGYNGDTIIAGLSFMGDLNVFDMTEKTGENQNMGIAIAFNGSRFEAFAGIRF